MIDDIRQLDKDVNRRNLFYKNKETKNFHDLKGVLNDNVTAWNDFWMFKNAGSVWTFGLCLGFVAIGVSIALIIKEQHGHPMPFVVGLIGMFVVMAVLLPLASLHDNFKKIVDAVEACVTDPTTDPKTDGKDGKDEFLQYVKTVQPNFGVRLGFSPIISFDLAHQFFTRIGVLTPVALMVGKQFLNAVGNSEKAVKLL